MSLIYKICGRAEWAAAKAAGVYAGSADDMRDGFIHFSTLDQLPGTQARHFAGRADLVLITVKVADLGAALKWEASRGGALFPHLFRSLSPDEAVSEKPLALDADGVPQLGLS